MGGFGMAHVRAARASQEKIRVIVLSPTSSPTRETGVVSSPTPGPPRTKNNQKKPKKTSARSKGLAHRVRDERCRGSGGGAHTRVPHVNRLIPAAAPRHPSPASHARQRHHSLRNLETLRQLTGGGVPGLQRVIVRPAPHRRRGLPRHRRDVVRVSLHLELILQRLEVRRGFWRFVSGHQEPRNVLGVLCKSKTKHTCRQSDCPYENN